MGEYGIRVYRVYDFWIEAEDLETAFETAMETAGMGFLCADDTYCEVIEE